MVLNFSVDRAEARKERVLLLGPLCKDPILSAMSSAGLGYVNKVFNSSPGNWESIVRMMRREDSFSAVLAQVTEKTLILATTPSYKALMRQIIDEMGRRNHAILIYTDNLRGEFTSLQSEDHYAALRGKLSPQGIHLPPQAKLLESLLELVGYLTNQSLRVIPYSFTQDLISMSLAFFQEV